MNDGLLALKRLKGEGRVGVYDEIDVDQDFDRAEYYLQAIDIAKEKNVDIGLLKKVESAIEYNKWSRNVNQSLNLNEGDFWHLKEVFDND